MDSNKRYIKDFRDKQSLQETTFFIPSYQRGYRWTPNEVSALCDDIWLARSSSAQTEYCLQPLVVYHKDNVYEVVDGQQRLITLFLILKHIQTECMKVPFSIVFERNNKKNWWKDLTQDNCKDHIEDYHLFYAEQTIRAKIEQWIKKENDQFIVYSNLYNYIMGKVFFIWHELPNKQSNVEEIFNRINAGKIQLTDAELIKCLLFGPTQNYPDSIELSLKWNEIERTLENDSFWYFLVSNESAEKYPTRIDMICKYLYWYDMKRNNKAPSIHNTFDRLKKKYDSDPDHFCKNTFLELKRIFEQLQEWYNDPYKYHAIGFLIELGISLDLLFEKTEECQCKSDIDKKLIDWIAKKINKSCHIDFTAKSEVDKLKAEDKFKDISYGEIEPKLLRNLLLFCNIATLITTQKIYYRFPFDHYKKDRWDIEHIHARNDRQTDEPEENGIKNLTLLDRGTNRGYKDKPFEEKRKIILEYEKQGKFIPLCTKNVFLKQYTPEAKQNNSWDYEIDGEPYQRAMFEVLTNFCLLKKFPNSKIEKES